MKTLAPCILTYALLSANAMPAMADFTVAARVETLPFAGDESADDAAIWVHPTDPALSLIIGNNKDTDDLQFGIHVFDLSGNLLSSITGDKQNNVDVRYGFLLGGSPVDIVASTNRTDDTIDLFTIDPNTRTLSPAGSIDSGFDDPYGLALWDDRANGKQYVFISDDDGDGSIRQFELVDNGSSIGGSLAREWNVGSLTEGLVVDDSRRTLFVGEENVGVWRYDADPTAGTGTGNRLAIGQEDGEVRAGDVEGLAILYIGDADNEQGYLLASEQGNNSFAILERYDHDGDGNPYEFLGRFDIAAGNGLDGVNDTDGIEVISTSLNATFPQGLFVAQDGSNDPEGQNYKLVSWTDVVYAAADDDPALILGTDPDFDPRDHAVPEPSTFVLLSMAAVSLLVLVRQYVREDRSQRLP